MGCAIMVRPSPSTDPAIVAVSGLTGGVGLLAKTTGDAVEVAGVDVQAAAWELANATPSPKLHLANISLKPVSSDRTT